MKQHEFTTIKPTSRDFQRSFVEHDLKVSGNMLTLKLIAESVRHLEECLDKDLPTTLRDLVLQIETEYQYINSLDQDDWEITNEDAEELGLSP